MNWKLLTVMTLVSISGFALYPKLTYGVGYEITEQNAKAMGLASAFTAWADNPSAVYYNTAGLSQIDKTEVSLGISFIDADVKLENNGNNEDDITRDFYVPNLFASTPLIEKKLFLGLGVYAPYGLGSEWDEDGITKYSAIKSGMETTFITPALAWQIIPEISLGAGISYINSEVELTKRYPFSILAPLLIPIPGVTSNDADVSLTGKAHGWGWTAGILAKPADNLNLGFSYRSKTTLRYKGDVNIDNISTIAQMMGASQGSSFNTDAEVDVPLPERYSMGIAYKLSDGWTVAFDYERIRWSALDSLDIDIENENMFFFDTQTEKDWQDTNAYKLGTEIQVTQNVVLRAGGFYYESPVPDETLDPAIPDADRYGFALGAGYRIGNFSVDIGHMNVFSRPRSVDNDELEANNQILKSAGRTPGRDRYKNRAYEIALSLNYAF